MLARVPEQQVEAAAVPLKVEDGEIIANLDAGEQAELQPFGDEQADRTLMMLMSAAFTSSMVLGKEKPSVVGDPGTEEPEQEPKGSDASGGQPEDKVESEDD